MEREHAIGRLRRATVLLTDFLVIAREPTARFYDFTSLHPTPKLVRLIELESGESAEMLVRIATRPDYGRRAVPTTSRPEESAATAIEFTASPGDAY